MVGGTSGPIPSLRDASATRQFEVPRPPTAGVLNAQLSRRSFLGWSAATAVGVASARWWFNAAGMERTAVSWLSPRGTLAVVDDYPIWVAVGLGYMQRLGVNVNMLGDVNDSLLPSKEPPARSISFPSPARLVSGADRGGRLRSIFQLCSGSVFGFATRKGGAIRRPQDLAGAAIAVGDPSWLEIVNPLLFEAGVDPRSTRMVAYGADWLKAASSGKADAALSWPGLERSPDGKGLRHLVGDRWSQLPANGYAVDAPERLGEAQVDGLTRFLRGLVMGLEFAQENPRAAAQITYRSAPGLASVMSAQATVDALGVTSTVYSSGRRRGLPWGIHEPARWQRYLAAARQLGMAKPLDPASVYTNALITAANSVDFSAVRLNAATFELDSDFRHTHAN
jgi:NitT/TauT family transport system substrate-binding protein